MNPQAAGELVHAWLQAHEDPSAVAPQSGPISRAVRALAPDAELVGIAHTATGPAMAVLLDAELIVLDAEPSATPGGATPPVIAQLVRIDRASAGLQLAEHWEERSAGGASLQVRVRTWRFWASGRELALTGTEVVQGGPPAELGRPDANERLGRAVAAKLGWQLP